MRPTAKSFLFLVLFALTALPAGAAVLLEADFEDQPVDVIIGTGGAEQHQPVALGGMDAHVRLTPTGGQGLEIMDYLDYGSRSVLFEFLGSAEITAGVVTISAVLHFVEYEDYNIYVREQQTAANSFCNLLFRSDASVYHGDADSGGNTLVGGYATGTDIPLEIVFDMDAGTCAITLDGVEIVPAQSHGVTSGRGVGSVHVGFDHDVDLDGHFYLQEIGVLLDSTPAADRSLGAVKANW